MSSAGSQTTFGIWIINKAGGLIYQRNYAGKSTSYRPLPHHQRPPHYLQLTIPPCSPSTTPLVSLEGLTQLSSNEYLVLASTFHSIHAIASRISPVPGSSGVETIEAETFKMSCLQTSTGKPPHYLNDPLMWLTR